MCGVSVSMGLSVNIVFGLYVWSGSIVWYWRARCMRLCCECLVAWYCLLVASVVAKRGLDWTGQDRTGQDRTGQDRMGLD